MHIIMRNPIWTGWRVIDKKRDVSASGRYASVNGRQADRRKVARDADEVIRVRVIDPPLIPEAEFLAVQQIMDLKQRKHWRCQPQIEHRFTYNGFLTCSICGEVVHTAYARADYYACKGRRTKHVCSTKYMAREKLEARLDALFASSLSSPMFLEQCVEGLRARHERSDARLHSQQLTSEISSLREKRNRVVDGFVEGVIDREERNRRLAAIEHDIEAASNILMRETLPLTVDIPALVGALAPLVEWEHWSRDQKRSVLAALVPDIRVANYKVESIGLPAGIFSHESTQTDRDSWPRRA
jgi:hypothetical protein